MTSQTGFLLRLFVRSQVSRPSMYLVLAIGMSLSVFVLCWLLSLRHGFDEVTGSSGRQDQMLVLRRGAANEVESYLGFDHVARVMDSGLLDRDAEGEPLASAEIYAVTDLPNVAGDPMSVSVRGIGKKGLALRPSMRITEGKLFTPGCRELIVGSNIGRALGNVPVGSELSIRGKTWRVVGVFDSGGEAYGSELWTDASALGNSFQQSGFQSMTVRITSPDKRAQFAQAIQDDKVLNHVAVGEPDYFAGNAQDFSRTLSMISWMLGLVMMLAACVSAANSMLHLVQQRRYDIGVLRSLGFRSGDIFRAVLLEGTLLTCTGSLLGWLAAYLALDGRSVNTLNMQTLSQIAFQYAVDWQQALVAIAMAAIAAVGGGLWPAWRAARDSTVSLLSQE